MTGVVFCFVLSRCFCEKSTVSGLDLKISFVCSGGRRDRVVSS